MNNSIIAICNSLKSFADSLCGELEKAFKEEKILSVSLQRVEISKSNISNPERPWMVGGATALAVGTLTAIFTNSWWSYLIGGCGIVSICIGAGQKNNQGKNKPTQYNTIPSPSINNFEVADKIINMTKQIENKWKNKVEDSKDQVQRAINQSTISNTEKERLLSDTYSTKRINFNFDPFIEKLNDNSLPSEYVQKVIEDFVKQLSTTIRKIASEQINIYDIIAKQV